MACWWNCAAPRRPRCREKADGMRENVGSYILPRDKGAAPLDFVIAVMAFLAALALGASLIADRAAQGWQAGLADRLTVQALPPEEGAAKEGLEQQTKAALAILAATPGIARAVRLTDAQTDALVAPWVGPRGTSSGIVADIPLPRLIDASIMPGENVDIPALRARLKQGAPDAVLDDHSRWMARLGALADGV